MNKDVVWKCKYCDNEVSVIEKHLKHHKLRSSCKFNGSNTKLYPLWFLECPECGELYCLQEDEIKSRYIDEFILESYCYKDIVYNKDNRFIQKNKDSIDKYFTLTLGRYEYDGKYKVTTLVKTLKDVNILEKGDIKINSKHSENMIENEYRADIILESMKKGKIIK